MLPLKYAEFLKRVNLSESFTSTKKKEKRANEGLGSRVRKLIDHYLVYARREKEQLKTLTQLLGEMEKDQKLFIQKYKRAEYGEELALIEERLKKKLGQLELVRGILKLEMSELERLLPPEQFKNWQFLVTIVSNRQKSEDGPDQLML